MGPAIMRSAIIAGVALFLMPGCDDGGDADDTTTSVDDCVKEIDGELDTSAWEWFYSVEGLQLDDRNSVLWGPVQLEGVDGEIYPGVSL